MTESETMAKSRYRQLRVWGWVATAILGAVLLALFLTESWTMFWLALLVFMMLLLLTTFPGLLAVLSDKDRRDKET